MTPNSPNGCQLTVARNTVEIRTIKEKSSVVRARSSKDLLRVEAGSLGSIPDSAIDSLLALGTSLHLSLLWFTH